MVCPVNCSDNPDAVDKLNWKCLKCGKNLKEDFNLVMAKRNKEIRIAPLLAKKDELESELKKLKSIIIKESSTGDVKI